MSKNGTKQFDSVAQVYAQALLDMTGEAGQQDAVSDEMDRLHQMFERHPDLLRQLSSRMISVEERAQSLERIFKGKVSDLLYRFLLVVNQKNRLEALPAIAAAYGRLEDERNGVVEADVWVAGKLSDEQSQSIRDAVGRVVGKNVVLREHVDESLLGGVKIRVGDKLMDGSVATQMRLLRSRLIEVGHQKARAEAGAAG